MSIRVLSTPLEAAASVVAYNPTHTLMAAADGAAGRLGVWRRDGDSRRWLPAAAWPAADGSPAAVTVLAWAAPEYGAVLAAGHADGAVAVWAQRPGGAWALAARLAEGGGAPALALEFSPRGPRPVVAAAYADGYVRLFEGSAPLAAPEWALAHELRAAERGGAATALSFRPDDDAGAPALPPLLAVGTAAEGAAVWVYRERLMRWERAAALADGGGGDGGGGGGGGSSAPIRAVAWAPTLGRPAELVAAASGGDVALWSLAGAADAPAVARVATLRHARPVRQLAWNAFGNWLAAATEGGGAAMWRPDLSGEWLLLNRVVGRAGGGGEEGSAMEGSAMEGAG